MLKPGPCLCLFLLTFTACNQAVVPPAKRPMPGDRVTPELHWSSPWTAGQAVPLFVRLRAEGAPAQPSRLVGEYDVPEDCKPRLDLVFLKAGMEIARHEQAALPPLC